jgi:hypothetical protein
MVEMRVDLLADGAPPPSYKLLLFAGMFLVVLIIVLIFKRREEVAFARPYEEEARRIGRVRCSDCSHEGPLFVTVRVRTGPDGVPKPQSADMVCAQCASPHWTPLSGPQA